MDANQQAMHDRRLQLARAGMWEMKRGVVYVPITTDEAKAELASGRTVYRYDDSRGPVEVIEIV